MISYFKEKSASAVFGLVILSIGVRSFFWVHPPRLVVQPEDGLLYFLLRNVNIPVIAVGLLYHVIVIGQALRLNYTLNDMRMFPKTGYTTALAYILITAILPAWNNITSALLANSIFIWLLFRFWKIYNSSSPRTTVYNIGMLVAVAVILYYPALPFILIAFFVLANFRPFRLNEWVILLIGILTPAYFLGAWLFLSGQTEVLQEQLAVVTPVFIRSNYLLQYAISFAIPLVAVFYGFYYWQFNSNRMVIQVRKNWGVLFWSLLCTIPAIWFFKNAWPNSLLLMAVPAAAFISSGWVYPTKRFISALLFWLIVSLIIYNNWIVGKF